MTLNFKGKKVKNLTSITTLTCKKLELELLTPGLVFFLPHFSIFVGFPHLHCFNFASLFVLIQLHYNSKTLKTESPNASRGSSLPRTLSKESKLYGMKDSAPSPPSPPLPCTVQSKTNTLLPPQPPPIPSGISGKYTLF